MKLFLVFAAGIAIASTELGKELLSDAQDIVKDRIDDFLESRDPDMITL